MPIPLAIWMAAGVGAAGVRMYKQMNDPAKIVKDAVARYREEKYKFFKGEEVVMPMIKDLAEIKLTAWKGYGRMYKILKAISNRPSSYAFKGHDGVYMMPNDLEHLVEIGELIQIMKDKNLLKIGTGIYSVVALEGGASAAKGNASLNQGTAKSALEAFVTSPIDSENLGLIEELAVFNAIVCAPQLLEDQDLDSADGSKMTKDDAFAFKENLDLKSLALADASARIKKLSEILILLTTKMQKLKEMHWQQLDKLEAIIEGKTDYSKFTADEKAVLNYGVVFGATMRELARTDVVITNGDITVVNRDRLHMLIENMKDLVPVSVK